MGQQGMGHMQQHSMGASDSSGGGNGAGAQSNKRGRDGDLEALLSRKTQRDKTGMDRYARAFPVSGLPCHLFVVCNAHNLLDACC